MSRRSNTGSPTSPSTPESRSRRSLDSELPTMDRFGQSIDISGRSGRKNTGSFTPRGSFSKDGSGRDPPVKKGSKEFAENYQPLLSARLGRDTSDQTLLSARRGEPSTPRKGDSTPPRRAGSKDWDNKDYLSQILAAGSDIDPENVRQEKEDPVHKEFYDAVTNGDLSVVSRILEEKKVNVNYRDNLDTTAIWRAAWDGQLSMVQLLVKYGADINFATLNGTGYTCLHAAAQDGHLAVVRYLKEQGADINRRHKSGWTPLWKAARSGQLPVVKYLVGVGADINSADGDGFTALSVAAEGGNFTTVQFLVCHGADVNLASNRGVTPLMLACASGLWAEEGHFECVQYLLENGAQMDAVDTIGRKAEDLSHDYLHSLFKLLQLDKASAECLECLQESNFELWINMVKVEFRSDLVRHFISLYPDALINAVDVSGFKAKDIASAYNVPFFDPVAMLREQHAKNPLDVAKERQIVAKRRNTMLLIDAAKTGQLDMIEQAITKPDVDVNAADDYGWTPLFEAVQAGHLDVVKSLIANGADIFQVDSAGWTPLYVACNEGHLSIVRYLAGQKGVDILKADKLGRTPIDMAQTEVIREFLLHGDSEDHPLNDFFAQEVQGLGSHREREAEVASSLRDRAKATAPPPRMDLNLPLQASDRRVSTGAPSTGGSQGRRGSVEDRLSARKSSVRIVTGFGRLRKKTESMDSLSGGMPMTARGSIDTNPSARDSASAIAALDASPGKKKGAGADRLSLNSQMQTSGSKAAADAIEEASRKGEEALAALESSVKDRGPVIRNMDQKHIMISYCNAPEARPDLVQQLADYLRDVHKYDVWKDDEGSSVMPARTSFTASFNASTASAATAVGTSAGAVITALKNGSFNASANAATTTTAPTSPSKAAGGGSNEAVGQEEGTGMSRSPSRASLDRTPAAAAATLGTSASATGKGSPIRASFNASNSGISRSSFALEKTITMKGSFSASNVPAKATTTTTTTTTTSTTTTAVGGGGNEKEKTDVLSVPKSMAEVIASSHTIVVCLSKEYKARQSCQKVAKFVRQRKMSTGQHNVYYVNMQKAYTTMTEVCLPMWDKDVLPFTADRLASMIGNKGKLRLYLTQEKLQTMVGNNGTGSGNVTDEDEAASPSAKSRAPFSSSPSPSNPPSEGNRNTAADGAGNAESDSTRLLPSIKTATTIMPFAQNGGSNRDAKDGASDKSANASYVSLPSIAVV